MQCRCCNTKLNKEFLHLNDSPPSNSFITKKELNLPQKHYPLKVFVCHNCFLVQLQEYKKSEEIFNNEYVYFSSFSSSWLQHAATYSKMIVDRLHLDKNSFVIEIACNDGYLLQNFVKMQIPHLGIDPTTNTLAAAKKKGVNVKDAFFSSKLAQSLKKADLIVANNVLAHTPYLIDFVKGLKIALKKGGTITVEVPHLLELMQNNQFDTIYHEHFSYFSLLSLKTIFKNSNLMIYDVQQLQTHGGSLRIYICHEGERSVLSSVEKVVQAEKQYGLDTLNTYATFQKKCEHIKDEFLSFLQQLKNQNKKIIGYGAAAKGNTLLNYTGIKNDLINYVVDKNPHKQQKYLPGSHIHVVDETKIKEDKPDYIVIFPWNIKDEIIKQLDYVRKWNAKFVVVIPKLEVI